jgi:hypothetical protein
MTTTSHYTATASARTAWAVQALATMGDAPANTETAGRLIQAATGARLLGTSGRGGDFSPLSLAFREGGPTACRAFAAAMARTGGAGGGLLVAAVAAILAAPAGATVREAMAAVRGARSIQWGGAAAPAAPEPAAAALEPAAALARARKALAEMERDADPGVPDDAAALAAARATVARLDGGRP